MLTWHFEDIPLLLNNLPHALHDLIQHEDKDVVEKNVAKLIIQPSAKPIQISAAPSSISIEKSIDPLAQKSAQNIGLLLQDYLKQLPSFDASDADGDKLLEHWREVMQEHPQRLAAAQKNHWHDDNSKAFWRDKIANHHTDFGIIADSFPDAWNDWQRASGVGYNIKDIKQLSAMKQKQWQDLIIRARLHKKTMARGDKLIGGY